MCLDVGKDGEGVKYVRRVCVCVWGGGVIGEGDWLALWFLNWQSNSLHHIFHIAKHSKLFIICFLSIGLKLVIYIIIYSVWMLGRMVRESNMVGGIGGWGDGHWKGELAALWFLNWQSNSLRHIFHIAKILNYLQFVIFSLGLKFIIYIIIYRVCQRAL